MPGWYSPLHGVRHRSVGFFDGQVDIDALWPGRALSPTTIPLKTYTGEQVKVLGTIHVNVKYQATVATLPLLVTEANGPSLFGRNWLAALHLNVEQLNLIQQTSGGGLSSACCCF